MLVDAHAAGQLKFFDAHAGLADAHAFKRFLAPLRNDQVGRLLPSSRSPGPRQVLRYLSRYTHRVAISNRRLVAADDERRLVPLEGLSRRRARALQDDDAGDRASSSAAS